MNLYGNRQKSKREKEDEEMYFKCEMNKRQFMALSHRLSTSNIEKEIVRNSFFSTRRFRRINKNIKLIIQWLINSWNTESVLYQNKIIIDSTGQSFCMQWAFPQAYYAIFGSILAMYKALGAPEESHTAVLKSYSFMMTESKLPKSISFCCDGFKKSYKYYNIEKPIEDFSSLQLSLSDEKTIDHQICQFLRATRKLRLEEKAPSIRFKTQSGERKKRLRKDDWEIVSKSLGPTNLIDFLYRKRIKGNYKDIEIFNSSHFDGETILRSLIIIVDRLNLVNESYIAKIIGLEQITELANHQLRKVENANLSTRLKTLEHLFQNNKVF